MREERDPVCGMSVDPANAPAESTYAGHTYYFCSENCRTRFDANPTGYSAGATHESGGMEQHEPDRTTKGGVTAPKFGSAGSGGAEFEQIPEQHRDDKIHEA